MSYRPITDDEHTWATDDPGRNIRGPCGLFISFVNGTVNWFQDQSILQKIAIFIAMLCLLGFVNAFIEDEHMSILVPSDGLCAKKV